MFIKEQSFLEFLCEVMLRSPSGEWHYGRHPRVGRANLTDVLEFLDQNINAGYYAGEIQFLEEHCKSKQLIFLLMIIYYFILNQIVLCAHMW